MDGHAVKEIARLEGEAQAKIIETSEGVFSSRPLHRLPLPERRKEEPVDVVKVSTLQALVDYLEVQKDGLSPDNHFLHVEGPEQVRVIGSLLDQGETNQRHTYAVASLRGADSYPWGTFMATEEMLIMLLSRFRDTACRARAFSLLGNIVEKEELQTEDDGVTQRATAKTGIAHLDNVSVKNPFVLVPFRTFREVEQPGSPFLLRLRRGGGGVTAGLFEADGGAWRLDAVSRVREWLTGRVGGYRVLG